MIYFLIAFLLLYLSYLYDVRGKTNGKKTWYVLIQVLLILLAGLRYRVGIDTISYLYRFYNIYPTLNDFYIEDWPVGSSPLFALLNSFVISLGGHFFIFQLFHALFMIVLVFKYFARHSHYLFTCAFFYFILCFFEYNMEIMRAIICIVICLYGNDYILNNKWLKGYLMYFVAILFHAQAVLLFFLPFALKFRLNKKGIIVLFVAFWGGKIIQSHLGDYLSMLELADNVQGKLNNFGDSEYFNKPRNITYILIYYFPLFIYTLTSLVYVNKRFPNSSLNKFHPFVMIGLFFLVLQMNVYGAYRFTEFFYVYMILYMSQMYVNMVKNGIGSNLTIKYFRVLLLFFPFFFFTWYGYQYILWRYIPYSSVLERSIDKNRENELYQQGCPVVDLDEY